MPNDYTIEVHDGWRKLVELITYIATQFEGKPRFGLTKLAKILYFSDFRSYYQLGAPITGTAYRRFPYGPLPTEMYMAIRTSPHLAIANEASGDMAQQRVLSARAADLAVFSRAEKEIIAQVIAELAELNALEVSAMSHSTAWASVPEGAHIPYQAAFLGDPEDLTQEDVEFVAELLRAKV
jgi:uncharacterized phage-associated protein